MQLPLRLPAFLTTAAVVAVLAQTPTFKGGYFKASDGTSQIGLDFDSAGNINVYVDNQAFAKSSWEVKKDTMFVGPVTGPAENSCANGGTYLWALAENVLKFTLLKDDCAARSVPMVNLVWTKG